jgi:excisionase family DNA binding protein
MSKDAEAVEVVAVRIATAAKMLSIHPNTVRNAINRGMIKAVHLGDTVLIPRSEIDRLISVK